MNEPRQPPVDLSACEHEPIHIPGAIQPHGILLAVTEPSLTIVQASANTGALIGREASALLGTSLDEHVEGAFCAMIRASRGPALARLNPAAVRVNGRSFDAIVHRADGLALVELEPGRLDAPSYSDFYVAMRDALQRLQACPDTHAMGEAAVDEVRRITGFDRVMLYRLHEDGHGEVVAERAHPDREPYLGLHYPASDIPPQARRLYELNMLRLIVDARYVPSPLVPRDNPLTGAPLDLGRAVLRSVSPYHTTYLRNMGVRATLTISLLRDGRLWGMLACHHETPLHVPYDVRLVCEFLGQALSWLIVERDHAEAVAQQHEARMVLGRVVEQLTTANDPVRWLLASPQRLLELIPAGGVAIHFDDALSTGGRTPPPEVLRALFDWLRDHTDDHALATDALPTLWPEAARHTDTAAGLLAIGLSHAQGNFLCWFRPERVHVVGWGGDPRRPVEIGADGVLGPRRSFAVWREEVRGRSVPWAPHEREIAEELRSATVGPLLRRAAEVAKLNRELAAAVRSRDDFLSMASHELKTPVTTILLQLDGLLRLGQRAPDTTLTAARVEASLRSAQSQTHHLTHLIHDLLDVSRIVAGRIELQREPHVDLSAICRDVLSRFTESLATRGVHLDVTGDVTGRWDPLRLDQIVTNLVTNAIKYGGESAVEVTVRGAGGTVELAVTDHGAGIPKADQRRIFQRFEQVGGSTAHYSGLGLGLWIVRHFVEAHGGHVWVESEEGQGATFRVILPRGEIGARLGNSGVDLHP